jgi:arsenate reductase-like glutaredoxin family protein
MNATGMQMMLKSFGIDPEKIKAELGGVLQETTANVMREVTAIKDAQLRIEQKLDLILLNQRIIDRGLVVEDDTVESGQFDVAKMN